MRDTEKYRALYSQILKGYSSSPYKKNDLFMRHLSEADIGFVSEKRNKYLEDAKAKGLPTEEEKLEILNEQDIWTNKEEEGIKKLEEELSTQEQTLKNLIIKSQKQILNSKILINRKKLAEKLKEKKEALDLTCEEYGERKSQEEIVYYNFFKDKDFKTKYFSEEEFDELPQIELHFLMAIHIESQVSFAHENIKRVAAFPFFLNSFFICNDDPLQFYGKPVVELTMNQVSLFSIGKYFKAMLSKSEAEPPETEDVDELIEWFESTMSKEALAKQMEDKQASTVVGASKEDLKGVIDTSMGVNLGKQAAKIRKETGKVALDMEDMLKLHGYNIKDGVLKNP